MQNRGSANSNIEIDESNHRSAPTNGQKFKNSLIAFGLGALLVQMYFFYGATKGGSFGPASIVIFYDNYFFWGYLAICGVMGWFFGEEFTDWLNVKISEWKFW